MTLKEYWKWMMSVAKGEKMPSCCGMRKEYAFCESVHASSGSVWHIRQLTCAGKKLGGGADTLALCGHKAAWDLTTEITEHHLNNNTCKICAEKYTSSQPRF